MEFTKRYLGAGVYSLNAAALLLGAAGLLSRVLGILRDRLLASEFGAGRELDLYYAAFQIPDFMVTLFILGAGSAAILPIFQEYLARDKEGARNLISEITVFFLAGASAACILAFILAPYLINFIVPGFSEGEKESAAALTRIMILSPLFFGLSGIFSSVVQSFHRFFAFAAAPLLYNIGIIAGIIFFVPVLGIKGVAWGVILGALLHLGIMFATVKGLGFVPHPLSAFKFLRKAQPTKGEGLRWRGISRGVINVMRLSFPRVLSLSFSQITFVILVAMGSRLASGSIAVFQLAQNLYFLPIGIFGVSYSVAIFPRLSKFYLARDGTGFFRDFSLGIRAILFWIMPSAVLFLVLRAHIVRVALGAGEFSWEDTRLTAAVLAVFVFSMFAHAFISFLIKGFYALDNTRIPLFINLAASAVSISLAAIFIKILSGPSAFRDAIVFSARISDLPDVGVLGMAIGFSTGVLLNFFLLYFKLLRLAEKRFGGSYRFDFSPVIKITVSAGLAGLVAYGMRLSFAQTLPLISFGAVLAQGVIAGVVGFAVYFGALFLMKEEEMYALWGVLRRRLFRIGALPPQWDGDGGRPDV